MRSGKLLLPAPCFLLLRKRYLCQRTFQIRRAACAVFPPGARISLSRLRAGRCNFAALAACMSSRFFTTALQGFPRTTEILNSTKLAFQRASSHRGRWDRPPGLPSRTRRCLRRRVCIWNLAAPRHLQALAVAPPPSPAVPPLLRKDSRRSFPSGSKECGASPVHGSSNIFCAKWTEY